MTEPTRDDLLDLLKRIVGFAETEEGLSVHPHDCGSTITALRAANENLTSEDIEKLCTCGRFQLWNEIYARVLGGSFESYDVQLATWLKTKRAEIEAIFESDEQSRAARATLTLVMSHVESGEWRKRGS